MFMLPDDFSERAFIASPRFLYHLVFSRVHLAEAPHCYLERAPSAFRVNPHLLLNLQKTGLSCG
jgi:hypothetical protein